MKKNISIRKSQIFVLLFLITVFVLFTPHLIRFFRYGSALMGDEPYYHARIARQIAEEGIPAEDSFVHGARPYVPNPYHIILAVFSMLFGVLLSSKIIPFICGILSVLVFYFILKHLGFNKLNRVSMSIVLLLSPAFIYTFTLSTAFCITILLDLLGFYLFLQKKREFFISSIIVFSIAAFFGLFNLFMILLLIFSYTLAYKKRIRRFYTLIFFLALVLLFYYTSVYFEFGPLSAIRFTEANLVQQFITDFGGLFGFSIFALLLSVLGIAVVWKEKKEFYYIYLIMLSVVLYSFFYNYAVVYSNFVISVLAGIAFGSLIKRKWKLKLIRNLSIILLFCGLLFSAVSYTVRLSGQQPNNELIDALNWLRQNSGREDIVFSHYTKGFWIEFQAQMPVVMDSLAADSLNFEDKTYDSSRIFNSRDIEETRELLKRYNVSFVLITADMQEGLVWNKPEQGLAYMLRNSETFKKEYTNQYAGVWRYIYSENG